MIKPDCKKCMEINKEEFLNSPFALCKTCGKMLRYQDHLKNNRKFYEGEAINNINDLLSQEWVLVSGRGKHIKVIKNMQLATVLRWLEHGFFKYAIRKDKEL